MLAGEPVPTGLARRRAKPPTVAIAVMDDPALPKVLVELLAARTEELGAYATAHELSVVRDAIDWWQQGWITRDPTVGIEPQPTPPDHTSAPAEHQTTAPRHLDAGPRGGKDAIPPQATQNAQPTRPPSPLTGLADLHQLAHHPIGLHELLQLSEKDLLTIYRGLRPLLDAATPPTPAHPPQHPPDRRPRHAPVREHVPEHGLSER